MSDNNGGVTYPVNVQYVGGAGSGSTVIVSGGSGPVTGSDAFYVNNGLDVRGFLSNSLGTPVVVSGAMQVLGNLIFNSSSLTGSGGASFTNSGSYLLTSSFNAYSASVNAFTASAASQIAALQAQSGTSGPVTGATNFAISNALYVSGVIANPVGDLFLSSSTGKVLASGSVYVPQGSNFIIGSGGNGIRLTQVGGHAAVQTDTGGAAIFNAYAFQATNSGFAASVTGSPSATQFNAGYAGIPAPYAGVYFPNGGVGLAVNGTGSLTIDSGSTYIAGNLNVSGTLNNIAVQNLNAFSASVNAYTASLTSTLDARYVTTGSFTNSRVVSMVTGTLDSRYAAAGGGGGGSGGATSIFTGSVLLSQSATPAPATGYGQVFASSSAPTLANALYFEDARGSITPAAGYDPVYPRIFEEEFLASNNNGNTMSSNGLYWPYFSLQGSGTGASLVPAQSAVAGHPGIAQLSTGTTASGYLEIYMNPSGIRAGSGEIDLTWIVEVPTLSDTTNTFTVLVGLGNTVTAGSQTQGLFFSYTNGTNSGKWLCNTIGTTADSGVAVTAGAWYTLRVLLDSTSSNGYFFINGALVATITTNLPNGNLGPLMYILKSLGTTARTALVDYMGMKLSGFSRA